MDFTSSLMKMASALAIVLGMMLLITYVVRRAIRYRLGPWQTGGRMRILASSHLGIKKEITLVQVGEEYLVLGVTPNHISLLSRLSHPPTLPEESIPEASPTLWGAWLK